MTWLSDNHRCTGVLKWQGGDWYCPARFDCLRYTCPNKGGNQVWMTPPEDAKTGCDYFINNNKEDDSGGQPEAENS